MLDGFSLRVVEPALSKPRAHELAAPASETEGWSVRFPARMIWLRISTDSLLNGLLCNCGMAMAAISSDGVDCMLALLEAVPLR